MNKLGKLRPTLPPSLRRQITDSLREAILTGTIEQGERINEALIAEQLQVSRSPIREAIRVLEAENLVETFDRRGSFVRTISTEDVEEVFQVLSMLEADSVRLAMGNLSAAHEKKLRSILRRMKNLTPQSPAAKGNRLSREFHQIIAQATQNKLLIKLRLSLRSQEEIFQRAYSPDQARTNQAAAMFEHLEIGQAILNGQADRAHRLMERHVQNAKNRAFRALEARQKQADRQSAA